MEMIQGTKEYLADCIMALEESELGCFYFSKAGSAKEAIEEGLRAGTLFVAVEQETFKGFLFYLPSGAFHSFPYLHLLVTKASERGTGIGTRMLQWLERSVEKPKLFLCVADFNPSAKRFYEKNGYVQVGTIESLYRPGITEYLMMKAW